MGQIMNDGGGSVDMSGILTPREQHIGRIAESWNER